GEVSDSSGDTGVDCGDGVCRNECPDNCAGGGRDTACGDRVCGDAETAVSCPADCGNDGGAWEIASPECGCSMRICTGERDYSGMIGLPDLGAGHFSAGGASYQGGLYPDGSNVRPPDHDAQGLALANSIEPINGKICAISIGMSNTNQKWEHFMVNVLPTIPGTRSELRVRNGAIGSRPIEMTADPAVGTSCAEGNCQGVWGEIENAIGGPDGCEMDEVQVVWMMHSTRLLDPMGDPTIPTFQAEVVDRLFPAFVATTNHLVANLPNLKLLYVSSRTYAGYGNRANNPEPFAHHNGFAVKWIVEEYIKLLDGQPSAFSFDPASVWVGWGPYLWADGLGSDGEPGGISGRELPSPLELACDDFQSNDGIHPDPGSEAKAGEQLRDFFTTDATAAPWFLQ
ncbi:MAG: hypothetical protein AAF721_26470, partial [Myxococcota bacterium]